MSGPIVSEVNCLAPKELFKYYIIHQWGGESQPKDYFGFWGEGGVCQNITSYRGMEIQANLKDPGATDLFTP